MNEIHNAINPLENIKATSVLDNKRFYKKKYLLALKLYATVEIHEYVKSQPSWGAKDVLIAIVKDYDPQLPSDILLTMTQFIVQEWEKVQTTKQQVASA